MPPTPTHDKDCDCEVCQDLRASSERWTNSRFDDLRNAPVTNGVRHFLDVVARLEERYGAHAAE